MCCPQAMSDDTFATLFARAVEIAGGSETKLAAAAGVSQNAIWAAKKAGRVSAQMAVRIEAATGGKVTRSQLRPDLWPASETAPAERSAA